MADKKIKNLFNFDKKWYQWVFLIIDSYDQNSKIRNYRFSEREREGRGGKGKERRVGESEEWEKRGWRKRRGERCMTDKIEKKDFYEFQ